MNNFHSRHGTRILASWILFWNSVSEMVEMLVCGRLGVGFGVLLCLVSIPHGMALGWAEFEPDRLDRNILVVWVHQFGQ